ncbi:hypothetical protein C8R43DRAFT_161678 [Mycena crocata]|nr:hypothetical protein C8R43DRAFT_161678 [Mycena crocata]
MTRIQTTLLAFMGALTGLAVARPPTHSLAPSCPETVYNLSSTLSDGPSQVKYISEEDGLMSPKILPVNGSSYNLWYFDVVSTEPGSLASVVVVFYDTAPLMFPFIGSAESSLIVSLAITFPNGTLSQIGVPSLLADNATVVGEGNGSSGDWRGTGFSWKYDAKSGAYDVVIDAPEIDVKGKIHFTPVGAPRYPCGSAGAGVNMEIVPGAGYSNALPDAVSTVDLVAAGTKHAFTGAGYLDQGWGPRAFESAVSSWYWGHGRVGPYSVVWFSILSPNGQEYPSAYLSLGDEVIVNNCSPEGSTTRPTGPNASFPPHNTAGHPSGYFVTMDLGAKGSLELNVTVTAPLLSVDIYQRSVGSLSGTIVSPKGKRGKTLTGIALLEEFVLIE